MAGPPFSSSTAPLPTTVSGCTPAWRILSVPPGSTSGSPTCAIMVRAPANRGAAGLCWLARVAAAAPIRCIVTLGTPGPRRLGPVRRSLAAATMAVSRLLGRFPARSLRLGNEDEAAEIIAEWMEWNVRGRWLGTDGFDYFAGLAALSTPYLGVAGGADWIFAPPKACQQVVERVGTGRKKLVIEPGLSHRGMVLSERARASCWPNIVTWLKETL